MKNLKLFLLSMSFIASAHASAGAVEIECEASGKSLSQSGGALLNAVADLTFELHRDSQGLRSIREFKGRVTTSPELKDNYGSYVGYFDIPVVYENVDYNPTRYDGYSQFKEIDTWVNPGSAESGMWGEFVLEKNIRQPIFKAHYIFKAGDHMGGTLHLNCRIQNNVQED